MYISEQEICRWGQTNPSERNYIEDKVIASAGHIVKCGKLSETNNNDEVRIDSNTLPMLSCTDVKCGWKKDHKRVLETYIPRPTEKHSCFLKIKEIECKVTPAQKLKIQEISKKSRANSTLAQHAMGRPNPAADS
ncbi:hypothetical protein PV326_012074, partial [Microctonus aethiopoides]